MKINRSLFAPTKTWKNLLRKPLTIPKKNVIDNPREADDNYRGFHINDWDECVGCGSCGEVCPTNAIEMYKIEELDAELGKKPERPAIDYGRCCFCALCVDICTSDSLKLSKEYVHLSTEADSFKFFPKIDGIHEIMYENGYERDDVSELLDLERKPMEEIPHKGRTDSFMEIVKGFSKKMALEEAARCVECGVCTQTCPANMNIPEYINSIWKEDLTEGLEYLYKTNPLSNTCGRICTHTCEDACTIGIRGEAVSIRWLKRYIVDNTPEEDFEKVVLDAVSKQENGKVAIIGAGPGGLAAGYYLRTLGYEVDVFDDHELGGGVVRYGIPAYRFPDEALDQDIKFIERIGVKLHMNTKVGEDIEFNKLKNDYDAVFTASGNWIPKLLPIENIDHKDVYFSTKFLEEARDYVRGTGKAPFVSEDVIVIGGGDVSYDIARTALRLQLVKYGKYHVEFIARKNEENLAASLEEVIEGREEGMIYNLERSPLKVVLDDNGNIKGVDTQCCYTEIRDNGKAKTCYHKGQTEFIKGTQVFMSVGSKTEYEYMSADFLETLEINRDKLIIKDNMQVKGHPWLFAGGDIIGSTDAITAIANGHDAAKAIDEFIRNK